MLIAQMLLVCLIAIFGAVVALTREPLRQSMVASFLGLLLTSYFFAIRAPDVSLAAIAVGTVGMPVMVLLALSRIRSGR